MDLMECSLLDERWKDSFDRLLDRRPGLRALNIIKKSVNVAYNIDSSVENAASSIEESTSLLDAPRHALRPHLMRMADIENKRISTPLKEHLQKPMPFKCSLSPVGLWKFQLFTQQEINRPFQEISSGLDNTENSSLCKAPLPARKNDVPKVIAQQTIEKQSASNSSRVVGDLNKKNDDGKAYKKNRTTGRSKKLSVNIIERPIIVEPSKCKKSTARKSTVTRVKSSLGCIKQRATKSQLRSIEENVVQFNSIQQPNIIEPTQCNRTSALQSTATQIKKSVGCLKQRTESGQTQLKPSKEKVVNLIDTPIIIGPSITSVHNLTNQSTDEHNLSEQIKKFVSRRISKCRKSVSALKVKTANAASNDYRQLVLSRCNQLQPHNFDAILVWNKITKCRKIGEGAYGEVFFYTNSRSNAKTISGTVLKIIPIEGILEINGETQKTFEQILPEIVTTMELSNLRNNKVNCTDRFVLFKKGSCIKGVYPQRLLKLWTEYDDEIGSENDNPEIFPDDQLYITLELDYGGKDMESYVFNNAEQTYLALQQVILALAIAEETFEFEHRDLHTGNMLVAATKKKTITFMLNNKKIVVPSGGINVTIIDYTLSRMNFDNCCLYNDLSADDELFEASGDYQYEVYRQMREVLHNDWRKYEPKTNIFWILYVIKKMLNSLHYKNEETKIHKLYLEKLQHLENMALTFKSAMDFANYIQDLQ